MKKKDLTGQVFGRLTVLYEDEPTFSPSGQKRIRWICECNCKNKTRLSVIGSNLIRGNTLSCGCIQKERTIKANKKYNKYDLSGEYGIGWTSNTNKEFYFDLEDYELIKDYSWYENAYGYVNTDKSTQLSRIILHVTNSELCVDHKNHNTLDNRKQNLRLLTRGQNNKNRKPVKNTVNGIIYDNKSNRWRVYISVNNKTTYIGTYNTEKDAIQARLEAEDKYYGEYSFYNTNENIINYERKK